MKKNAVLFLLLVWMVLGIAGCYIHSEPPPSGAVGPAYDAPPPPGAIGPAYEAPPPPPGAVGPAHHHY